LPALIDDAKAFWTAELGPGDSRIALLDQVTVGIADLEGLLVGNTQGSVVVIDPTAAGYGWYLSGALNGRVDLLTVVRHEFGHAIGFDHDDAAAHAVMDETITLSPTGTAPQKSPNLTGGLTAAAAPAPEVPTVAKS